MSNPSTTPPTKAPLPPTPRATPTAASMQSSGGLVKVLPGDGKSVQLHHPTTPKTVLPPGTSTSAAKVAPKPPPPTAVKRNAPDVEAFLKQLGLPQYFDGLFDAGYDTMKGLMKINDDKLKRAQVDKEGHRDRILDALQLLNAAAPPTPVSPGTPVSPVAAPTSATTITPTAADTKKPLSEAAKFLSENAFSQYVVGFESKGFETMRAIKLMTPSDIEACGVPTGHAKLIHAAIVALSPLPLSPSSPVDTRPELQALSTLQCGVDLTNGKSCNSVLQLIKPGVATKLIGSEIYPSDDVLVNTQMNEVKFSCEEVKSQKEYAEKTAAELGIKGGTGVFAAGVGAGFSKVMSLQSGQKAVSMFCRIEKSTVKLMTSADKLLPRRAAAFVDAVKALPVEGAFDKAAYYKFIQTYGTHRVTLVAVGGERRRTLVESDSKSTKTAERTASVVQQALFEVKVTASNAKTATVADSKSNEHFECWGGSGSQDYEKWQAAVAKEPHAFVRSLAPLEDLFADFPKQHLRFRAARELYMADAENSTHEAKTIELQQLGRFWKLLSPVEGKFLPSADETPAWNAIAKELKQDGHRFLASALIQATPVGRFLRCEEIDSGSAIRRFSSPLYLSRYDTKGLPLMEPVPLTSNVWQIVAAPTFQTVAESGYVPSGTEQTTVNIEWSIGVLVEEISRNSWWVQHRWGSSPFLGPPAKGFVKLVQEAKTLTQRVRFVWNNTDLVITASGSKKDQLTLAKLDPANVDQQWEHRQVPIPSGKVSQVVYSADGKRAWFAAPPSTFSSDCDVRVWPTSNPIWGPEPPVRCSVPSIGIGCQTLEATMNAPWDHYIAVTGALSRSIILTPKTASNKGSADVRFAAVPI